MIIDFLFKSVFLSLSLSLSLSVTPSRMFVVR